MELNKISSFLNFDDFGEKKIVANKDNNFGEFLNNAVNQVNEMQLESEEYKKMLAVGELDNLHDLSIASEKANVALQVTMSIRGKIVEAYKEIMRIQI